MNRLSDTELKARVIERENLKKARDSILGQFDGGMLQGGQPNMAAMMGLVSKVGDLRNAFELTRRIEQISDELTHEIIMRVRDNGNSN